MAATHSSPFGSWKSPITSDLIVAESIGLGQIALDGGDIYWVEMRPSEGGRHVLCKGSPNSEVVDVTPAPFSVRSRVHEYGGGAFAVSNGVVYFTNFADQRLYRQEPGGEPQAITPEGERRYADCIVNSARGRFICVREDHTDSTGEAVNALVALDAGGEGQATVLVAGNDFYSSPRVNPDGTALAWLTWNHPNMPWEGTELWVAGIAEDGALMEATKVAGGPDESIAQPEWSPEGVLHFVSDRSGWWNLYRWRNEEAEPLFPAEAEFSRPQWAFGLATYGFLSEREILCAYNRRGKWGLGLLEVETGDFRALDIPYTEMGRGDLKVADGTAVFEAASPSQPMSLIGLDIQTGETHVLRRSVAVVVDAGYVSQPQPIEFPTEGERQPTPSTMPQRTRIMLPIRAKSLPCW